MRVLILGSSGTIGTAIHTQLSERYEVYGTYNKNKPDNISSKYLFNYGLGEEGALKNILDSVAPHIVVSSLTGDFEKQLSEHRHLAEYLKDNGGRLIFLSTANVFDGFPDRHHSEEDIPYPISDYGKFKYACEQLLESVLKDNLLIVRLCKIYSAKSARLEIERLRKGQSIFSNLYMSYNTADNVAKAISYFVGTNNCGTIHLTSTDCVTTEQFAKMLLEKYNTDAPYISEALTPHSYCDLLDCNNPDLLKIRDDGNFNLSLKSLYPELTQKFGLSCYDVVNLLL